jgi:hypothetical protein
VSRWDASALAIQFSSCRVSSGVELFLATVPQDSQRAPQPTRHHRWLVLPTQELSKPDENYSPSPSNCARHHVPGVQRPRHSIAFEGILITPSIPLISPHQISLRLADRPHRHRRLFLCSLLFRPLHILASAHLSHNGLRSRIGTR